MDEQATDREIKNSSASSADSKRPVFTKKHFNGILFDNSEDNYRHIFDFCAQGSIHRIFLEYYDLDDSFKLMNMLGFTIGYAGFGKQIRIDSWHGYTEDLPAVNKLVEELSQASKKNEPRPYASATIISVPKWVETTCPFCGERFREDIGGFIWEELWDGQEQAECPECGKVFVLEEIEYE